MTHDDELDQMLRDAARGYNEPPAAPRDEMWTRIAAARARSTVVPITRRWNAGSVAKFAAGIAAVLLVGVALGRMSAGGGTAPAEFATQPGVDTLRQLAIAETTATSRSTRDTLGSRTQPDAGTRAPASTPARRGAETRQAPDGPRRSPIGPEQSLDPQAAQRLYQLVALQHFGRTEALLTAFRAESRQGAVDARIASWSRDLLSTTRLLLDSPAAEDPQLRLLLSDLEILLAKLAQHAGAGDENTTIINDALGEGELLDRLRNAVPASVTTDVQGE